MFRNIFNRIFIKIVSCPIRTSTRAPTRVPNPDVHQASTQALTRTTRRAPKLGFPPEPPPRPSPRPRPDSHPGLYLGPSPTLAGIRDPPGHTPAGLYPIPHLGFYPGYHLSQHPGPTQAPIFVSMDLGCRWHPVEDAGELSLSFLHISSCCTILYTDLCIFLTCEVHRLTGAASTRNTCVLFGIAFVDLLSDSIFRIRQLRDIYADTFGKL